MRALSGLATIAGDYRGFIIDIWGVIHDGIAPYDGAMDCLARLRGRPVLLLSNAPRRAEPVRESLQTLGIDHSLYTDIVTSGEATWQALRDRSDNWFRALGRRVYHIGPKRDRSVIEGLDLFLVSSPRQASFVLNTGPDDLRDSTSLHEFKDELDLCLASDLTMLCANPDIEIVRGGKRILCAGALAEYYASAGGDMRLIGKPEPAIYDLAIRRLGLDRTEILAVGDSLRTDIQGAARSGIDSIWIMGGIHAHEIGGHFGRALSAAQHAGISPVAALPALRW